MKYEVIDSNGRIIEWCDEDKVEKFQAQGLNVKPVEPRDKPRKGRVVWSPHSPNLKTAWPKTQVGGKLTNKKIKQYAAKGRYGVREQLEAA